MALVQALKRLAGIRPDDVEAAATALKAIEDELSSAAAEFSAAQTSFGARLVVAMGEGTAQSVEADLEAKRRHVERLTRAREAVAMRLQAAQEAAGAAELAKRWDVAEKALRAQRLALVRFQRAAHDVAAAMLAAEAAGLLAYRSIPVRGGVQPYLIDLSSELQRQLAMATDGRHGHHVGSLLDELKQQPSLIERAEANAARWLAMRPEAVQVTPQDAA